jgi:inosine-uridine nucleoside N-ribohydrolase
VVRNVVAFEGAKEFKDHGFPIHDHLACKAKASATDESHVAVSCTGTTTRGQSVALVGTTNDLRGTHGLFLGTVDGRQVFAKACLDC